MSTGDDGASGGVGNACAAAAVAAACRPIDVSLSFMVVKIFIGATFNSSVTAIIQCQLLVFLK
jgi:hypothetical protein